jgi:NHLM bacteriocin system ABC transporter peptidase/ATP-binding protein
MKSYVKTPTVFQMEATECGAASLAMILAYYGKFLPLELLRVDCGVSRDGCNAKNILRGGRKYHLTAKGYKKGLNALIDNFKSPSIIHWEFNHFVVYEGKKGQHHYINDPARGRRRLTLDELDKGYTGIVLEFEPDEKFEKSTEKRSIFSYALEWVRGEELSILFMFLTGLCLVFPGLIIPAFSKIFIDDILLGGNKEWFTGLAIAMISMTVLRSVLSYVQTGFLVKLQTKMALYSTDTFLYKLFKLPIQFFQQRSAGDLEARIGNNEEVANFFAGQLSSTLLNLVTAIFYLSLLLVYSVKLTLIGIAFSVFNIMFLRLTAENISNKKMKMEQDNGKLNGALFSGLRIINSLKASGVESQYVQRIAGYYAKVIENEQNLGAFRQYMSSIPGLTNQLSNLIILLLGSIDVINGNMTIGTLLAFQTLMGNFLAPVNALVAFAERIQDLKVSMMRLNDINNYDQTGHKEKEIVISKGKLEGYVTVKDLSFGYSVLEPPIVSNFSFMITPGMQIAFVGPSGSGKSTVSNVVSGLYEPWGGEILFDGVNKDNVNLDVLGDSLSIVSQSINFFSGTVMDNLTMWDENIKEIDVINACKDALIHDVITEKKNGYYHKVIEGGSNFSGGQKQRLEIARALVKNPSILIFDEATSALDSSTEKAIMDNIRRRGCTTIIVAHRLSAIRDSDEIIVLDSGDIVQRGTHEALACEEGHYKELIANM